MWEKVEKIGSYRLFRAWADQIREGSFSGMGHSEAALGEKLKVKSQGRQIIKG